MTFLECVTRILRLNAIIRGDTDVPSTFDDVQHNASLNIAILATQNELIRLIAERLIPKERNTSGSITLATNTRVYNLATGFTRFYGAPHFYNSTQNRQIYEYPGGLEKLQIDIFNFATQYGQPNWWYWEPSNATLKQVGFFQVPSSSENGQAWTYDYEASVMVTLSSDNMPFHNDEENFVFAEMSGRRFKFMYEDTKNEADIQKILDADTSYRSAKATLLKLIKGQNPSTRYGHSYA